MDEKGLMIVGIGNTLRRDDGAGVAVVERLRAVLEGMGVVLVTTHQLLPELAEEIAAVSDVVFVDARTDVSPGRVTVEEVSATAKPQAANVGHYVTPEQLMAISCAMYGRTGRQTAHVIGIGAANMDHGEELTMVVHHAVSRVVDLLHRGVLNWTCGGRFSVRERGTAEEGMGEATLPGTGACELKWSGYIKREMRDA